MLNCLYTVSLSIALGAGPGGYGAPQYSTGPTYYGGGGYGGGASMGMHGHSFGGGFGGGASAPSAPTFGSGVGDQLYPYDTHWPWMHGYFQEIPAYGGYGAFRPYNYKHVLAQSQAAAGWGLSPQRPYSQQFWHRYQASASMSPAMHAPETHQPYTPVQPIRPSQFQSYQMNYQPGYQAGYQPLNGSVVPTTGYSPSAQPQPQTRPAPPKHSAEMMRQRIAEESRRLNLNTYE